MVHSSIGGLMRRWQESDDRARQKGVCLMQVRKITERWLGYMFKFLNPTLTRFQVGYDLMTGGRRKCREAVRRADRERRLIQKQGRKRQDWSITDPESYFEHVILDFFLLPPKKLSRLERQILETQKQDGSITERNLQRLTAYNTSIYRLNNLGTVPANLIMLFEHELTDDAWRLFAGRARILDQRYRWIQWMGLNVTEHLVADVLNLVLDARDKYLKEQRTS